jgi:hypothetical protein
LELLQDVLDRPCVAIKPWGQHQDKRGSSVAMKSTLHGKKSQHSRSFPVIILFFAPSPISYLDTR